MPTEDRDLLKLAGDREIARAVGISHAAVAKWKRAGSLPGTAAGMRARAWLESRLPATGPGGYGGVSLVPATTATPADPATPAAPVDTVGLTNAILELAAAVREHTEAAGRLAEAVERLADEDGGE